MGAMPDFQYSKPATLAEALRAHGGNEDAAYVAGGTDLLVNLRRRLNEQTRRLVDLSAVPELQGIEAGAGGALRIGGGVTLARLCGHPELAARYPVIAQAARSVAGPTHRASATVGGNLCLDTRCVHYNESDWWRGCDDYCLKYKGDVCRVVQNSERCHAVFAGDLAPALLVMAAEVELAGPGGVRRLPLAHMYREDGAKYLAIEPGEILVAVHVPPAEDWRSGYIKTRVRDAIDFPLTGVAVALRREGDVLVDLRVAFTGTNSCPVVVQGLEPFLGAPLDARALTGMGEVLRGQINPLKTTMVTPKYRRRVAAATMKRLVGNLWMG